MNGKWIGYIRVSTGGQTAEVQIPAIERWAKANDIMISEWSTEIESTRKTRPVKEGILIECRAGRVSGIVIAKLDRWARSSLELITDLDRITGDGGVFVSVGDLGEINPHKAASRLQLQILAAFAEFERNLIRERTMEGLAYAKEHGRRGGRPMGRKDTKQRKYRTR
jgi:DNA invertase Pin-like site-specific DNA recombinase